MPGAQLIDVVDHGGRPRRRSLGQSNTDATEPTVPPDPARDRLFGSIIKSVCVAAIKFHRFQVGIAPP